MKISINEIRFRNAHDGSAGDPAPDGVTALLTTIGAQLAAVEEVVEFGKRFEGAIIAKVVTCQPMPDSDHLNICKIDDGHTVQTVERDADGHVQVVCGAPNVRAGITVVWLPPGTTVPESYDKQPFVLEVRPLRGHVSNGMLASPRELSLSDNHDGILVVTEDIEPGTLFVDACHLQDDVVIDMENKMFTHRPDCFGWMGVAREIEGIQHRPFKSPEWYVVKPDLPGMETDELPVEITNDIPELVPRFAAIALRGVQVGPSPLWLQADLARAGMKSINNIVDYSNFYMLLTGQPIHIYDYDKVLALSGGKIAKLTVRHPKKGETIALLNGKTITPRAQSMMVAAGNHLVCVGGAMGGTTAEVDANTRNIIIEVATWDMYEMRRTSMEHGIFTDAVTRFTKGQSPLQNLAVLGKITATIRRDAHGKVASKLIDINHVSPAVLKRGSLHAPVNLTPQFVNERLGLQLSASDMATLLENVEFGVAHTAETLTVTAPFWRTDIEIPEDVVEEIGRLYGYDQLPIELPAKDIAPAHRNSMLDLKSHLRDLLAAAGANEVLNYSFVHGDLMAKVGQDKKHAFQLSNALSPDLQYYRLSLTPSLLEKIHPNIKAGHKQFALFEMNKVHIKGDVDCDDLPREYQALGFTYASDQAQTGASFYAAKRYLTHVLDALHVPYRIVPAAKAPAWEIGRQIFAPFEPKRSAYVLVGSEDDFAGFVGEYRASVVQKLKLPVTTAGFEIDLQRLLNYRRQAQYKPLLKFPATDQDICFKVKANVSYDDLVGALRASLAKQGDIQIAITPVDIYQREANKTHKQITVRVSLQHPARTLTTQEVNILLDNVAADVANAVGARRI